MGFAVDGGPGVPTPAAARPEAPPSGWLIDRVDLPPEQRALVDSILDHYARHMSHLQAEYRPRFRSIVDSTTGAIMEVLDEDQRATYDSILTAAQIGRNRGEPPSRR